MQILRYNRYRRGNNAKPTLFYVLNTQATQDYKGGGQHSAAFVSAEM